MLGALEGSFYDCSGLIFKNRPHILITHPGLVQL
ncbi:hypothetical protein LARV_01284 [Longilinea arvoryzae]|uniref:Uncharacterized protein n=1 Tax=Longilinea arvoryzae TaxID=360412 RepID=A0A0S7BIS0_9CHLR|nr:hypothetical protein LARV_01284 [Longilinea arvoryzae]